MPSASSDWAELTISFEAFRLFQRLRVVLREALTAAPLQADEYAIYSALLVLGETTQTQLAESVGMPLTTVAEYVRAMHTRRHLVKRPSPQDRRAALIRLSAAGRRAHASTSTEFARVQLLIEESMEQDPAVVRDVLKDFAAGVDTALEQLRSTRSH